MHTASVDEEDGGATAAVPPSTQAAPELAWSLDDDEAMPVERHSWRLAWVQAAVFVTLGAVSAFAVGAVGWVLVRGHDDWRQAPPVAHRPDEVTQTPARKAPAALAAPATVTVEATPPTVTVKATPPTVTVKATPPTVTVEPAPTTVTVPAPAGPIHFPRRSGDAAPHAVDPAADQRFLDQMRSLGYVIVNQQLILHNAHEACRLLRQGDSPEQVDQEMAARMGTNTADTLQLVSSAMLAYPDCY